MRTFILLSIVVCLGLGACAPRANTSSERASNGADGEVLLSDGGRLVRSSHSYRGQFDDVYYQALRIARSATVRREYHTKNWFLASEDPTTGVIRLNRTIRLCVPDDTDTILDDACSDFARTVTLQVTPAGSSSNITIEGVETGEEGRQLIDYLRRELDLALN